MSSHILVVDDELSIRTSLSSVLEDEGYTVATAKDGEESLELIRANPPAVVMLDIWMPKLDASAPW